MFAVGTFDRDSDNGTRQDERRAGNHPIVPDEVQTKIAIETDDGCTQIIVITNLVLNAQHKRRDTLLMTHQGYQSPRFIKPVW